MSGVKGKSGIYKRTKEHIEKLKKSHLGNTYGFKKGQKAWNKGLTKKTDKRVKQASEHQTGLKKDYSNYKGKKHHFYGKHHNKKWKRKMREKMKNNVNGFQEGQIPWNKNKKFPEKSGANCHLWKGGKMKDYSEKDRIRRSMEYKLWRRAIFERDNFTCQKYGIRGGKLIAHHINNFADFEELRLAIDNGITLSEKAHRDFHKIYGRNNNTKEQLKEFLMLR